MASILVNSLKRLYAAGRITKEQIGERVEKGTITATDYQEITGEEYDE
ncbi:MAG: XkdX family protein [Lachnospiraceae bacterium]|nr:XkdX family protein [Lachnospiraceae bacterium]